MTSLFWSEDQDKKNMRSPGECLFWTSIKLATQIDSKIKHPPFCLGILGEFLKKMRYTH